MLTPSGGWTDHVVSQIEAAASGRVPEAPSRSAELARFLVANQREMADIIAGAQAEIDGKSLCCNV
ncbi:MAG: hypothetical protein H6522_03330 [Mycolicibacterium sp.]|nr:hypothetical protein [Mycolicibacterium sp.]